MSGLRIRPFRDEDLAAVAEICVQTADAGADATGLFRDDRLWADVFAVPYVVRHPEFAWVVEEPGGAVVGYVVGTPDTDVFEAWFREEWWPARRQAYEPSDAATPREREILRYAAARAPGALAATAEYPAHLHIDLLPAAQGKGLGRVLIDTMLQALAVEGVPGLHLGVDPRNVSAVGFYERVGFVPLPSKPDVVLLGIRLR